MPPSEVKTGKSKKRRRDFDDYPNCFEEPAAPNAENSAQSKPQMCGKENYSMVSENNYASSSQNSTPMKHEEEKGPASASNPNQEQVNPAEEQYKDNLSQQLLHALLSNKDLDLAKNNIKLALSEYKSKSKSV